MSRLESIKLASVTGKDVLDAVPGLCPQRNQGCGAMEKRMNSAFRSLELAIINGTNHTLRFCGEYFDSGTWVESPSPIDVQSGEASIGCVANREMSILCGVTGGAKYEIVGTNKYLYIGFTNPTIGCYKTFIGVDEDKDAKWGYDHAYDEFVKNIVQGKFHLTAALRRPRICPFKLFEYTITPADE